MIDFFKKLFKPDGSSTVARERLRLVLLSDHLSLAPDVEVPSELVPESVEPPDPSPDGVEVSPDGDLADVFMRLSVL